MASTCNVYKGVTLLGSGSCAAASVTISSWSANLSRSALRRNVTVVVTEAGTHTGRSWNTYCSAQAATLTLRDACPFVGA